MFCQDNQIRETLNGDEVEIWNWSRSKLSFILCRLDKSSRFPLVVFLQSTHSLSDR